MKVRVLCRELCRLSLPRGILLMGHSPLSPHWPFAYVSMPRAFRIPLPPQPSCDFYVRERLSSQSQILAAVLFERGYGDITPEVHAAVAGVAQDRGPGSRRLFWRAPLREEPKPAGPPLVLARGRSPLDPAEARQTFPRFKRPPNPCSRLRQWQEAGPTRLII